MHSVYARANAIFAFMLWVLTAITIGCFLSTVFTDPITKADIVVEKVHLRLVQDPPGSWDEGEADLANFIVSVKIDVTKAFNWNVKQLFLYLVSEYTSEKHRMNQLVVWDQIVLRADRVVVDERKMKPEYWMLDDGTHLLNHPNVTFVLRYNVVPNVGYLRLGQADGALPVAFPAVYRDSKDG